MKQAHLRWSVESMSVAIRFLQIVKAEDIKSRKSAKQHHKKKWTSSIADINQALEALTNAKRIVRKIPKRV